MAGLGWLFSWAKENGIEPPKGENGSVDIQKLLKLYDEWCAKNGGKGYRQNASYEDILKTGKPKFEKATGFNRLETKHHQRHAKEMGFKNTKEYEKAAVEFFNSDKGKLYYSERRKNFYRYDEKTGWFCAGGDGFVYTLIRFSKKKFEDIKRQDQAYEI